jgi:hypothetical protein
MHTANPDHIIAEIKRLGLDKTADVDALIIERDAADLDTEGFYAIFHSIGLLAADLALNQFGSADIQIDKRQLARVFQLHFREIEAGFAEALENLSRQPSEEEQAK